MAHRQATAMAAGHAGAAASGRARRAQRSALAGGAVTKPGVLAMGLLAAAIDPDHPERANDRAAKVIEELRRELQRRQFCGHCGRKI